MGILFAVLSLIFSVSLYASEVGTRPMRSVAIGSTLSISYSVASTPGNDSRTYQGGKEVSIYSPQWNSKKPYCSIHPHTESLTIGSTQNTTYEIVSIEGNYSDTGIADVIDHPFFRTELLVKNGRRFIGIECVSYKPRKYGEITVNEFESVFDGAIAFSRVTFEDPGLNVSKVADPLFTLDVSIFKENMTIETKQDIILQSNGLDGEFRSYVANLQDDRLLRLDSELVDVRKPFCQLIASGELNSMPEKIFLKRGFESGFENVIGSYTVKDNPVTHLAAGFRFGGKLKKKLENGMTVEISCSNHKAASYPRFLETTPVTKSFIEWVYNAL